MNKLTPEKFGLLKGQVIDSRITTIDILKGIISFIFDKAVLKKTFYPMYAQLCSDLNTNFPVTTRSELTDVGAYVNVPKVRTVSQENNYMQSAKLSMTRQKQMQAGTSIEMGKSCKDRDMHRRGGPERLVMQQQQTWLVHSFFAIFTFEPLTLSLTSMPSCYLESLTNILKLCLILKASNKSLRKSLSLNLELS
ncbi:eukaryotic translation initiation factor-like protein [Tanacetum coccineum]|uniref:Eukaryotic translation initiation factor-like protein n=1 Tax=Tanacetum coccineum TaxID=301880 RepID=A0ABQ5G129_9ASTR